MVCKVCQGRAIRTRNLDLKRRKNQTNYLIVPCEIYCDVLIFHNDPIFHSSGCKTVGGTPCVFPFRYDNKNFNSCTTIENSGIPWCSTKTGKRNKHIKGNYGDCDEECSRRSNPGISQFLEDRNKS